jgi:putative ABC transport system permease protein
VTLAREDARAVWLPIPIESVWQDARYAVRTLTREPAFALLALATLALGIGATTAIFSAVYAIALKPLPYADADRLVMIWSTNRQGETQGTSLPDLRDWQSQNHSFGSTATYQMEKPIFTGGPAPRTFRVAAVSPRFFETLGVPAWKGRTLTEADAATGRGVAVISYDAWQQLGADPGLAGRTVQTADGPVVVVGVMPAGFQFPFRGHVSAWLPMSDEHGAENNRRARGYPVIGRLGKQTTLARRAAACRHSGREDAHHAIRTLRRGRMRAAHRVCQRGQLTPRANRPT